MKSFTALTVKIPSLKGRVMCTFLLPTVGAVMGATSWQDSPAFSASKLSMISKQHFLVRI